MGSSLPAISGALVDPPAVVFATAYDNYAVQAFDLNAIDYLLKPVRTQRLLAALQKVRGPASVRGDVDGNPGREMRAAGAQPSLLPRAGKNSCWFRWPRSCISRPTSNVTARTREREYILDEALTHLEQEFAERFLRLHRAVLVARDALAGFERAASDEADAYGWALVRGVPDRLPVSRRQWAVARALATGGWTECPW